jgi:hypothetical protein
MPVGVLDALSARSDSRFHIFYLLFLITLQRTYDQIPLHFGSAARATAASKLSTLAESVSIDVEANPLRISKVVEKESAQPDALIESLFFQSSFASDHTETFVRVRRNRGHVPALKSHCEPFMIFGSADVGHNAAMPRLNVPPRKVLFERQRS